MLQPFNKKGLINFLIPTSQTNFMLRKRNKTILL